MTMSGCGVDSETHHPGHSAVELFPLEVAEPGVGDAAPHAGEGTQVRVIILVLL